MSQTPTKGPYKLEQWQQPDGTDLHCVCHAGTVCPKTTVANFANEADALLLLESLNIHHETNQTPRQILESREALRAALENLAIEMRHVLHVSPNKDGGLYRKRLTEAEEALTLAKEGGPK